MTKLLCTGDLHIGAGAEYGRAPGDRLQVQEQVWRDILELAVDEAVDGILFAGDAFEGPTPTSEHYDAFLRPIREVLQDRIPILAVSGNGKHDSAMRTTNALAVFNGYGIDVHARPEVVDFAGCAVACLPWVSPARLVAHLGADVARDEVHAQAGELLVDVAAALKAELKVNHPGRPAILLGHWSVSGASLPHGLPVDQLREPVIPIEGLDELGYDHIVLGHIHRPQTVGERGFYVGSPMPLNFGEEHVGHGVSILHVGEHEEIDFPGADYREIDSPRFVTLDYDWTQTSDLDAIVERVHADEVEGAIVRLRYRATAEQQRRIDVGEMRRLLLEGGAAVVKIVPDIVREQRARVEGVDETLDELAALDLYLEASDVEATLAGRMRDRTRDYLQAVA